MLSNCVVSAASGGHDYPHFRCNTTFLPVLRLKREAAMIYSNFVVAHGIFFLLQAASISH
jgi:hypothetical protein